MENQQDFLFRQAFVAVEAAADFSEALVRLRDDSSLRFRHRVGERWIKAEPSAGLAQDILGHIERFRLNGKHLDILFQDGSSWEVRFR